MKNVKGSGTEAVITLRNVRMSFVHLFEKGVFNGVEDKKYSVVLLLDKDENKVEIEAVNFVIKQILKEKNKGKRLPPDKYCMRDGAFQDRDETRNAWTVSAKTEHPVIIDRAKKPVEKSDGLIYSGAYVNATISLWFQDNPSGKRVNAQLRVVQFSEHGESLGSSAPSQADIAGDLSDFEEFESEDDPLDDPLDEGDDDDVPF